jgi:hypothetical protein
MVSCAGLEPDYFEASPYLQSGSNSFARPVNNFDEDAYGLLFTVGWNVGQMSRAYRNLAALDVSRSGELTLRDMGDVVTNVVQQDAPGSAMIADDGEEFADVLDAPHPTDDAFLPWAFGILLLAASAWVLGRAGLRLPYFQKGEK